jgi:protocatechuate 3,4-dioxygenase beta subunit
MEPRVLLDADPLQIGVVYIEEDIGTDVHGDTFELTFVGGAPGTELKRIVIDGDQDAPGFGRGDVFFDTLSSGLGADNALPFSVTAFSDRNAQPIAEVHVDDGTSMLIIEFNGFRAGDRLQFSLDVDEVEDFDAGETDPVWINDGFDPITSGVEFQGSILTAEFAAPHYHDVSGSAEFRNRYDDNFAGRGLGLPADNEGGKRDRSAGAVMSLGQEPLAVSIAGTVFLETNVDLVQDVGEPGLEGVQLALWQEGATGYEFTGYSTATDSQGDYIFDVDLNLKPGTYQVRETQPPGLLSVGAIPGNVDNQSVGRALDGNPDILTEITIPLGDQHAVDYDFAEARPAEISGFVYHDRSNDGVRDGGEEGIADAEIRIVPVETIGRQEIQTVRTDAQGFYRATGLAPGSYRVVERQQPNSFFDGLDTAGTVDGKQVGAAVNPGDRIENVFLGGGQAGVEYNFGEIAPASLRGHVYLSDEDGNCYGSSTVHRPLENVQVRLLDAQGGSVAMTTTNAQGAYVFRDLLPGSYTLVESTPEGLIDGGERVGTVEGVRVGRVREDDVITEIALGSGQHGEGYDFCEHPPAALSGFVYHDENDNAVFDAGEEPIVSVQVDLVDAQGQLVATVRTNALGAYAFAGLHAGTYSVVESQPSGWLDGRDAAGRVDGIPVGRADSTGDRIEQIQLGWGDEGVHYDFGELLPVSIRGIVYHDRDNNGRRDATDEGLEGVRIDVIPTTTQSPQAAVTVFTDASGAYAATGLAPGIYRIVETQPDGYVDGTDVVGTVLGVPVGIALNPGDQIDRIRLASGQHGIQYNFGEFQRAAIHGSVFLSAGDGPCFGPATHHEPLPSVKVTLLDAGGVAIAETRTNVLGRYAFRDLLPGSYAVVEHTPAHLIDGGERVGSVDGVPRGAVLGNDRIGEIELGSGDQALGYDFCEHPPAILSGHVFHDENGNGKRDAGESPIDGVEILLRDEGGQTVAGAKTNNRGEYAFVDLHAGTYSLEEIHPLGWLDGLDVAGVVDGIQVGDAHNPGDIISRIHLGWGDAGEHYDFGELLASSIAGTVHVDLNRNCLQDPGEKGLPRVRMELHDQDGDIVARTVTAADGGYRFDDLLPGTYTIREVQPSDYFHGGQRPGEANGDASVDFLIQKIEILSGRHLENYDFCEIPPAAISGYVFQDGAPILTIDGQRPENLHEIRDGKRTEDDTPLAGVVLELRNGFDGDVLPESAFLPGHYPDGAPRVVTDANGYYEFTGLRGGGVFNYAVYQRQPDGLVDGIDTPGSTSGVAFNEGEPINQIMIERLTKKPDNDAIVQIPLNTAQVSEHNNFSEVRVTTIVPPINPPPPTPVPTPNPPPLIVTPDLLDPVAPPVIRRLPDIGGQEIGSLPFTWHLSVVDAGLPRDAQATAVDDPTIWVMTSFLDKTNWRAERLLAGRWTTLDSLSENAERRQIDFGIPGAIPVVGDFNGDGLCEVGVYYQGEWFLDLNGNGRWDAEDLWAQLGTEADLPVVGDWDGDGKDDIGIFGPEWVGDPRAIRVDPGLPDVANRPHSKPKNVPPKPEEATDGRRLLRLNAQGPRRADLIDHVFRFGEQPDHPISGDWNGDGIRTVGVFRDGQWRLDLDGDGRWTERDVNLKFGREGDLPIVGDFNGDGVDELGVYRQGMWYLDTNGNRELDAHDRVFALGGAEGTPVTGDWDGDGIDEPGVYQDYGYPTSAPADE